MFGKLLKYDLKSMIKTMLPLWGLMLVLGIVFAVQMYIQNDMDAPNIYVNMMAMLLFVFVGFLVAILVVNIIIVIQRFWNGLLKEEGYLMFTLPISVRQLILSKMISAVIISAGSFVICSIVISMMWFGLGFGTEYVPTFMDIMMSVSGAYDITSGELFIILYLLVWLMAVIYKAYAAMAIGHLSNRNRFLCAFGAYIALHIVSSIVSSIAGSFEASVIIMIIYCVIQAVVYHIIVEYILTKHLNLE